MNIDYWKEKQNRIQDVSHPFSCVISFNAYKNNVEKLYSFLNNTLYNDFSKENIAEAFGLILLCISCTRFDIRTVNNNPPAEKLGFQSFDEALTSLVDIAQDAKSKTNELYNWRFLWRGLWVTVFKSKISENDIIEYFDEESLIHKWTEEFSEESENDQNKDEEIDHNTILIIDSLRKTGYEWEEISNIVNKDETIIKNSYLEYLEKKNALN